MKLEVACCIHVYQLNFTDNFYCIKIKVGSLIAKFVTTNVLITNYFVTTYLPEGARGSLW